MSKILIINNFIEILCMVEVAPATNPSGFLGVLRVYIFNFFIICCYYYFVPVILYLFAKGSGQTIVQFQSTKLLLKVHNDLIK